MTTRSYPESSKSRACAPSATVRLKRQLRFMGRTRRPGVALASAAAWAKAECAMLAPAMNVPVVLRKLRRSMVPPRGCAWNDCGVHYLILGRSCKRLHRDVRMGRTLLSDAFEVDFFLAPGAVNERRCRNNRIKVKFK